MKVNNGFRSLVVSATRVKLIHQLFYFPHEIHYVRELVRSTGEEINSVLFSRDFICNNQKNNDTVDIIFVGTPTLKALENLVKAEQEVYGREINYMVMDKTELQLRRNRRDPVIIDFFLSYPAVIIGSTSDLSHFE